MSGQASLWCRLGANSRGSVLVETAFVAPVLMVLCLGGVEVSHMIAKQGRLQSVAEQATEIVLVAKPEDDAERSDIQEELQGALPDTATVDVDYRYRCGTAPDMTESAGTCDEELLATYIQVKMTDTYEPTWTQFGIGRALQYDVERTVQVS